MKMERIPPSRIPYFFYTLIPTLLILMITDGLSDFHQPLGNMLFLAIIAVWWLIVARQLLLNTGGLTIDSKGLSYRLFGKPGAGFDIEWANIEGFEVRRGGLIRGIWIKMKGPLKPQMVTGSSKDVVSTAQGTLGHSIYQQVSNSMVSFAQSFGGAYLTVYWLKLRPIELKMLLDKKLQGFQAGQRQ